MANQWMSLNDGSCIYYDDNGLVLGRINPIAGRTTFSVQTPSRGAQEFVSMDLGKASVEKEFTSPTTTPTPAAPMATAVVTPNTTSTQSN